MTTLGTVTAVSSILIVIPTERVFVTCTGAVMTARYTKDTVTHGASTTSHAQVLMQTSVLCVTPTPLLLQHLITTATTEPHTVSACTDGLQSTAVSG